MHLLRGSYFENIDISRFEDRIFYYLNDQATSTGYLPQRSRRSMLQCSQVVVHFASILHKLDLEMSKIEKKLSSPPLKG